MQASCILDGSAPCHCPPPRLENTLNYGMERIWAIAVLKGSNSVAFGFDEGLVVVKIGATAVLGGCMQMGGCVCVGGGAATVEFRCMRFCLRGSRWRDCSFGEE
jgi:hypothetical protein